MLFQVNNLGPLREATIDLSKKLVVLVGPNNAGKTYLTWAIYGLATLRSDQIAIPPSIGDWADALIDGRDFSPSWATINAELLLSLAQSLQVQLADCFAADPARFEASRIRLTREADALKENAAKKRGSTRLGGEGWDAVVGYDYDRVRLRVRPRQRDPALEILGPFEDARPGLLNKIAHDELREQLSLALVLWIAGTSTRTFAFPVERLALNLFARELAASRTELVGELYEQAEEEPPEALRKSLRERAVWYPRVLRDALQRAIRMRGVGPGPLAPIADEIEANVLGGKLSRGKSGDLEFTVQGSTGAAPLGLHQSASMIKSLASLVWYLRYEARPGDRVIIDEPELNLHPDNQRRVARALAKLVRLGLQIIMSTHSDYLVRELNNLIMLSQDSDTCRELAAELGYDPLCTLQPQQLGVYLVNAGECSPVEVKPTGFEVRTIDEEIHRLNCDSQSIYARLFCT